MQGLRSSERNPLLLGAPGMGTGVWVQVPPFARSSASFCRRFAVAQSVIGVCLGNPTASQGYPPCKAFLRALRSHPSSALDSFFVYPSPGMSRIGLDRRPPSGGAQDYPTGNCTSELGATKAATYDAQDRMLMCSCWKPSLQTW